MQAECGKPTYQHTAAMVSAVQKTRMQLIRTRLSAMCAARELVGPTKPTIVMGVRKTHDDSPSDYHGDSARGHTTHHSAAPMSPHKPALKAAPQLHGVPVPIAIVGPTASGKSALGIELARQLGGEIVNCDSMQLYRGMDIGTAKLSVEERGGIPHHLLDIWDVTDTASVARYQQTAVDTVEKLLSQGITPIIVGGSMLYVQALLDNWQFPPTDPQVRARWEEKLEEIGIDQLHAHLATIDPDAAAIIEDKDPRRTVRALEVIELTGQPFQASQPPKDAAPRWNTIILGLKTTPEWLNPRIEERTRLMFEQGFIDEVSTLVTTGGLVADSTAGRAIGYAQVLQAQAGELDWAEVEERTVIGTRRYVRRQRSWFNRDPRIHWIDAANNPLAQAVDIINNYCTTDTKDSATTMTHTTLPETLNFAKGHGTENDFVIIEDPHAELTITDTLVAAICDRRAGIGGDGLLRVVRAHALVDSGVIAELPEGVAGTDWFMDYYNADGSIAEMCGNGTRVFAHYVRSRALVTTDSFTVGTRAGAKPVTVSDCDQWHAQVGVEMGPATVLGVSTCAIGADKFAGVGVDMGNPHLACVVPGMSAQALAAMDLVQPVFDPDFFPEGVNVEIVTEFNPSSQDVHMRVFERGVGETRSCGTGTVAAARAALADAGLVDGTVTVHIPGGSVTVTIAGETSTLEGPSAIVATGTMATAALKI